MAERLNAHDSKSCYAGMYTRVQIPFSAPQKGICRKAYLFLFDLSELERDLRVEPFCESKTLCLVMLRQRNTRWQSPMLITSERGAPPKAQIPFSAPQKEIYHQVYLFLFRIERLAGNLEFSRVHAKSGKRISLSLPHDLSSDDALLRSNKIFLCTILFTLKTE